MQIFCKFLHCCIQLLEFLVILASLSPPFMNIDASEDIHVTLLVTFLLFIVCISSSIHDYLFFIIFHIMLSLFKKLQVVSYFTISSNSRIFFRLFLDRPLLLSTATSGSFRYHTHLLIISSCLFIFRFSLSYLVSM